MGSASSKIPMLKRQRMKNIWWKRKWGIIWGIYHGGQENKLSGGGGQKNMAERELLLSLQTLGSDFNPEHTDIWKVDCKIKFCTCWVFSIHEVFGFWQPRGGIRQETDGWWRLKPGGFSVAIALGLYSHAICSQEPQELSPWWEETVGSGQISGQTMTLWPMHDLLRRLAVVGGKVGCLFALTPDI